MKRGASFRRDAGKDEITFGKLVQYHIIFFLPLFLAIGLAWWLAPMLSSYFQASRYVLANIQMIFYSLLIFFCIVPFIRARENIAGVRRALFGFLIVGFCFTIPALTQKNYGVLLATLIPIANYILVTFIYCPEVLGMDVDIGTWFEHYKQLTILIVYGGMILLYVCGFGWLYFNMAIDQTFGPAFDTPDQTAMYSSYVYYSVIIFGTIGFGDVTPITRAARFLSAFEAILALIINVIFIAILFVYVSNFREFLAREERKIARQQSEFKKYRQKSRKRSAKQTKKKKKRK